MTSTGVTPKRYHPTNFLCTILLFALALCNVMSLVGSCKSWEQCLTVSECRKIQKQNNIREMQMSTASLLFPCDETLMTRTICCAVKQPVEDSGYEVFPGYNISYGESEADPIPAASEPLAQQFEILPTDEKKVLKRETGECGMFHGGGDSGEDATRWQFPWLALLGKKNKDTGEFLADCGASLIDNRHVLTSANCLEKLNSPPELVRLGDYERSIDESQETGLPLHHGIEKIIVHERYNYPILRNDIALIRMDTQIPHFSDCLRPICLPEDPSSDSAQYIMAGWRTHGSRGLPSTSKPKFGPLSLNNSGLCDLPIPIQSLAKTELCFGSNPSSCFGDFGGPLIEIIKTADGERAVQAGIFSYGGAQCNAKFAGELYTKIFPLRDWILKNMEV